MTTLAFLHANLSKLEKKLHYAFSDRQLLILAMTHASYLNEHRKEIDESNERLEFLGDAVLNLLISNYLYTQFSQVPEGDLSRFRAAIINKQSCFQFVQKWQLDDYVLLGEGERQLQRHNVKSYRSTLSNLFEAILGAVYLDSDQEGFSTFFFFHFLDEINTIIEKVKLPCKTELQNLAQRHFGDLPTYSVILEEGLGHQKQYVVAAYLGDTHLARGRGASKKEAENSAAKSALNVLKKRVAP